MILLQKRSTERGVPIELPHHRDSTDRWSTKDKVGKSRKPPAVWHGGPKLERSLTKPTIKTDYKVI